MQTTGRGKASPPIRTSTETKDSKHLNTIHRSKLNYFLDSRHLSRIRRCIETYAKQNLFVKLRTRKAAE